MGAMKQKAISDADAPWHDHLAERDRLRAVNAQLLAILETACSDAYVSATNRSTNWLPYLPAWYDAALAAIAIAKAGA